MSSSRRNGGRIEAGWQKWPTGAVQVGSTWLTNPTNLSLTAADMSAADQYEPTWNGLHVDLTREQINRLIRELRTARDQAFGRDE